MRNYTVKLSKTAKGDMQSLYDYITFTCKSYKTANDYQHGLFVLINSLKKSADVFQISTQKTVLQYGWNARRINYKKMTIIFTIHGNIVLIRRIISGAMIIEL